MGRRPQFLEAELKNRLLGLIASAAEQGIRAEEVVKEAKRRHHMGRMTVYRYLSEFIRDGLIVKEEKGYKKTYYKVTMAALNHPTVQRLLFTTLSLRLFNDLAQETAKSALSDEEFSDRFVRKVGVLALYTILKGFSLVNNNPKEASQWIEEGFGTLMQKDCWRVLVARQIYRRILILKEPINSKESFEPELVSRDGTVFFKRPIAFEPGFSEKVFQRYPEKIPEGRVEELKSALRRLYPQETSALDEDMASIARLVRR